MQDRFVIPKAQWRMVWAVALGIPLSAWDALYPRNTYLQIGPVLIGIPITIWLLRRWPISNGALGCIAAFVMLHLFSAHWTYSYVPYNLWVQDWFGFDLDRAFGFTRNMFDRLIHTLFGMLMMLPLTEIAIRHARVGRVMGITFAILFVGTISALYEIFEWVLTLTLSPADTGAYNGEQGDVFDNQKDMACAIFGSLLLIPTMIQHFSPRRRNR